MIERSPKKTARAQAKTLSVKKMKLKLTAVPATPTTRMAAVGTIDAMNSSSCISCLRVRFEFHFRAALVVINGILLTAVRRSVEPSWPEKQGHAKRLNLSGNRYSLR